MAKDDVTRVQLEELLASWSQGEVEKTLAHFAPSIRHRICGTEGFVHMDRTIQGMDEFLDHMEEFSHIWELLHFEPISIIAEGNRAVSHVEFQYRHIPTGRIVESEAAQLWQFENGKVVELIEFLDTALFASLGAGK